jgi:trigger factor
MDITQTKSEGLVREFNLVISPQEIEKKLEDRLSKLGKTIKVDGFRPGKIPLDILRQRYETTVKQEVLEQAIQDGTRHLIETHKLKLALQPKIDIQEYLPHKALECHIKIEILPEIQKVDLSKFNFEYFIAKVEDQEINQALERLQKNYYDYKALDGNTKAQKGHIVHLSFKGTSEGKAIPGGASEGMDLELGSNTFIPGFEEELIGLKNKDKKEFDIIFPLDYHAKELAGKKAHFFIEIKAIKEKILPELTPQFAKKFGKNSMEELKKAISEQLLKEHKSMSLLVAKRHILDIFAETFKFDIPEGLVELEFNSIWEQSQAEDAHSSSKKREKKSASKDDEKLREQYRALAERRVLLGLLLAEIGREHKISVSSRETDRAITEEAMKYPGMEQKVIDYYRSNTQAQAALRAPLFEDKVIECILQKATIKEKQISLAELEKKVASITEGDKD